MKKFITSNNALNEILADNGIDLICNTQMDILVTDDDAERIAEIVEEEAPTASGDYTIEDVDLAEEAYNRGLNYCNVTRGRNGYPENVTDAIIGFEDFEEAEEVAKSLNAEIVVLHKLAGWDLWEIEDTWARNPLKTSYENYCTNGTEFRNESDIDDFFAPLLDEVAQIEDEDERENATDRLLDKVDRVKEYYFDYVEEQCNDYIVVNECGDFVTATKDEVMTDTYDAHTYTIAVMYL